MLAAVNPEGQGIAATPTTAWALSLATLGTYHGDPRRYPPNDSGRSTTTDAGPSRPIPARTTGVGTLEVPAGRSRWGRFPGNRSGLNAAGTEVSAKMHFGVIQLGYEGSSGPLAGRAPRFGDLR